MVTGPALLYVTPVTPALTGNGLAMRSGMVLEALSGTYSVSVLVLQLYGAETALPEQLASLCVNCVVISGLSPNADGVDRAAEAYRDCEFDAVHVFRLAAVPFARPYLQRPGCRRPRRHLDLDDIESNVRAQIAGLLHANGDEEAARAEQAESKRLRMLETALLPFFDRVYVCSEEDRRELSGRCRTHVCVLPNGVRSPGQITPVRAGPDFRFLFLATFGYYPNHDAAVHFCGGILPELRRICDQPFGVDLVGAGVSPELRSLAAANGVHVAGAVPEVRSWYERASAVIVPMRAGGGTRIKILEAFSFGRPVIATTIGLQGLRAVAGEHVLVADTPLAFAFECRRSMTDAALASSIANRAMALVDNSYSIEVLRNIVLQSAVLGK